MEDTDFIKNQINWLALLIFLLTGDTGLDNRNYLKNTIFYTHTICKYELQATGKVSHLFFVNASSSHIIAQIVYQNEISFFCSETLLPIKQLSLYLDFLDCNV